MNEKCTPQGFGLIIVGNEILDGRRRDLHLAASIELLAAKHIPLRYAFLLPDDPALLQEQLSWAMQQAEPFFCCGGIGATPDDHTRGCAAAAAGVALEPHAEGVRILKERFGARATPERLEMVNFPAGASLIPNPVNQVPGFRTGNGFFLPGFPEMARPMMAWVLESFYETGEAVASCALFVYGSGEADLAEMMRDFVAAHPRVSFSSLPHLTADGSFLELGIRGPCAALETARLDLIARLDARGVSHNNAATP